LSSYLSSSLLEEQRRITSTIEKAQGRICGWVFHRNGRPIKSFRKAWQDACEAAGVPDRIPHDLRRTAVRNLERAGVSRSVAMQLTGHETESVYRRYAIVNELDLAEGVEKLAAGTISETIGRRGKVKADAPILVTCQNTKACQFGPGWRNWQTHRT